MYICSIWCIKDDKTAQKTLHSLSALLVVFAVILTLTGMAAQVLVPEAAHEMALPLMIKSLLPSGISGIMLVALLGCRRKWSRAGSDCLFQHPGEGFLSLFYQSQGRQPKSSFLFQYGLPL